MLTSPLLLLVFWTASIQLLLWRDQRKAGKATSDDSSTAAEDSEKTQTPLTEKVAGY
jgi:preprotein translocase subunit YajC